jgi:glutamyl-tRNA synthetase
MLSVVVDDHDMGITHIIRGDDHLTNAFRQYHIYEAMGWSVPAFAHIPLIHGSDGAKLSKRHGALGVDAYRSMGYLPQSLNNHLLRLGWGRGDEEIISMEQAIEWFSLEGIGRSAARFDLTKLTNLNSHYIRHENNHRLLRLIMPMMEQFLKRELTSHERDQTLLMMDSLKQRAKTLDVLAQNALIVVQPSPLTKEVWETLSEASLVLLEQIRLLFIVLVETPHRFNRNELENLMRGLASDRQVKLSDMAQPLRIALTGSLVSPSIFEIMEIIGAQETLKRIEDLLEHIDNRQ